MSPDLTAEQTAALTLIFRGRRAWSSGQWLERRGVAPGTLEGLEASRWVERWLPPPHKSGFVSERWKTPEEVVWTLTPWGARMLGTDGVGLVEHEDGAVILETGSGELPRWGKPGEEKPSVKPSRWGMEIYNLILPELIEDPRPGPEFLLDDENKPLAILGAFVAVDRRIRAAKPKKKPKRKKPARRGS